MKKKTVLYLKLIGILSAVNFLITAMVCLIGGWRNAAGYSNALFISATLAFFVTFILYLSGFAKRGSKFLKHYSGSHGSTEDLRRLSEKEDTTINISIVITAIAAISLIGAAIAAMLS